MIKFTVQIGIPGYLDAEDNLSNLLQGEGEEEELRWLVRSAVCPWFARWMPSVPFDMVEIEVKQE